MKEITDEELASFLEGTLPEGREKEVADAIDSSKELQALIEASLDIDDILMFEEMGLVQHNPQTENIKSNRTFTITGANSDTKWGKYLSYTKESTSRTSTPFTSTKDNHVPRKGTFRREATNWEEEEYRRAADSSESEENNRTVETRYNRPPISKELNKNPKQENSGGFNWGWWILIGLIVVIVSMILKNNKEEKSSTMDFLQRPSMQYTPINVDKSVVDRWVSSHTHYRSEEPGTNSQSNNKNKEL